MIGAIIGDVVGSVYEFNNVKSKEFEMFGKGTEFTDDTVLTLALADALLSFPKVDETNEDDFKREIIKQYHDYGCRYPFASYGEKFAKWVFTFSKLPYNSLGNGSAMRVSAAGWYAKTLKEAEYIAKLSAEVTHNHPEGIKGAQSVAAAIWMARNGASKNEILDYVEKTYYPCNFMLTLDEIRPLYFFDVTCQGTVPIAMIAFFEANDFMDTLKNSISVGGDSDTVAAIACSIAEAFYDVDKELEEKTLSYLDDNMKRVLREFEDKYGKR